MNDWYILDLNSDKSIDFYSIESESDDEQEIYEENMNYMGETFIFSREEAENLFKSVSNVLYGQEF